MSAFAVAGHQSETFAVSRAVGHTRVGETFADLLAGGGNDRGAVAIDFILPAEQSGPEETNRAAGDDFRSGHQFGEQGALAGGNFSGFDLGQFALSERRQILPNMKSLTAAA